MILNYNKRKKIILKNFYINLIGKHNVLNATASIALALSIGINQKVIKQSLKDFKGVQRRMTQLLNLIINCFMMIMLIIQRK